MTHLLTFVLSLGAFAALALATERQQEDLFGGVLDVRRTRALRAIGWGLLAVALFVIVRAQGWGLGLVSYSGHTSLAAGVVYLALVVHGRMRARARASARTPAAM